MIMDNSVEALPDAARALQFGVLQVCQVEVDATSGPGANIVVELGEYLGGGVRPNEYLAHLGEVCKGIETSGSDGRAAVRFDEVY